jgi:hypothetical protein
VSRSFEFKLSVRGYRAERLRGICGALQTQWDFDPSDFPLEEEPPPKDLSVSGVDELCGGTTAEEMADRLAHAVWSANGAYCEVEVWSTFLDVVPPSDVHTWNDGDYQEWIEAGGPQSDECVDQVQQTNGEPGA